MSYYRPFTTNTNNVNTDVESDTDSTVSSEDGFLDTIGQRLDDPRYAIIRAAGPTFDTVPEQLFYQSLQHKPQNVIGYAYTDDDNNNTYDPSNNIPLNVPLRPFIPANTTTRTTLFSFTSANRDMNVYPLSTFFTLKTPRTYKNITNIQFVQINFPYFLNSVPDASGLYANFARYVASNTGFSFANCYACLGNAGGGRGITTSINGGSFSEAGRTNPVANSNALVHTFTIRGGDYDSISMANEMDKQMNTTPPFNIISYTEHRQLFLETGSIAHLFNDPGRWYYSYATGQFVRNASKSIIINDYLPNANITGFVPTEKEIFVAYFYPVLKAALQTHYDGKFLNFGAYSSGEVHGRVLNSFEGLASTLYYEVCYTNVSVLKSIRRMNTFEYNPINSYNYTYSPANSKMIVSHTDLHPSIQKDIQTFQQTSKTAAAAAIGLTNRDLLTLSTTIQSSTTKVADLSRQLQAALVGVGVPINSLTTEALANPQTPIFTQIRSALQPNQMTDSDDALIALAAGQTPSLSPPAFINRSFPASFGWSTIQHLVGDITNAVNVAPGSRAFTAPYLAQIQTMGDVPALYSTFVNYYSTNTGALTTSATIQTRVAAATSNYVHTKYGTVFPPALLENNNYLTGRGTGAVTFYGSKSIHYQSTPDESNGRSFRNTADPSGCCVYVNAAITNFYSCLPAEYVVNTPFYKLGYGFADILSFYSTNSISGTTAKNNIYLQLNTEQSLNNMDTAGTENYNITNETTGEYRKVFGKLLTQGSTNGQITQTIVQIPATFPLAPLASLDHFSFNFFLDTMVPLNRLYPFVSANNDWNAIIQIDELVGAFDNSA